MTSTRWHKEEEINILNIYAPNVTESDGEENKEFWNEIRHYFIRDPHINVDILSDDFNMVEDAQDRAPMRLDPDEATEALDSLKQVLYLRNAWRDTFPTRQMFSFFQEASSSMSRIDRIYMSDTILTTACEWNITPSTIQELTITSPWSRLPI